MTLRWNWRHPVGGEPMTRILVPHMLTREDLACLLIARLGPDAACDLEDLPRRKAEEAIREQLLIRPDAMHRWQENYAAEAAPDGEGPLSVDEVLQWARKQVARL